MEEQIGKDDGIDPNSIIGVDPGHKAFLTSVVGVGTENQKFFELTREEYLGKSKISSARAKRTYWRETAPPDQKEALDKLAQVQVRGETKWASLKPKKETRVEIYAKVLSHRK